MSSKENTEADIANNNSNVPAWVTQEYFEKIVSDEFPDFQKITNFKAENGSAAGDNYASVMLRILIEVELKDGSTKEFPLMMKTTHETGTAGAEMIKAMGIFDKEIQVYDEILPAFEKMYLEKGKTVTLGPKSYKLSKDPGVDTVVLEDLRPRKFRCANRIEGLDMDHTKTVLRMLAEFHAASAVYYETVGPFPEKYLKGLIEESQKEVMTEMWKPLVDSMKKTMDSVDNGGYYKNLLFDENDNYNERMMESYVDLCRTKYDEFNVLNHGDSWCNNFMFTYTDEGKQDESILVDFQMCKYGSPAQDLLYFMFSTPKQEIRLSKFDYLIKYYHDKLVENLKILDYPKQYPTLSEIHITILKHRGWARNTMFGTLAIGMLEKTENANMDNFMKTDEEGDKFRNSLFSNPRYIKCLNEILPWLENRGMLEY